MGHNLPHPDLSALGSNLYVNSITRVVNEEFLSEFSVEIITKIFSQMANINYYKTSQK